MQDGMKRLAVVKLSAIVFATGFQDLTIPMWYGPHKFAASPLFGHPSRPRTTLLFFRGALRYSDPTYSRGVRQVSRFHFADVDAFMRQCHASLRQMMKQYWCPDYACSFSRNEVVVQAWRFVHFVHALVCDGRCWCTGWFPARFGRPVHY
jgi:hypothetical protein